MSELPVNNPFLPSACENQRAIDQPSGNSTSPNLADATRSQRLTNFLVDGHCCLVLFFGVKFFLSLWALSIGIDTTRLDSPLLLTPVSLLVILAYYTTMEARYNATLGKMLTRTRVLHLDGRRADFRQIVIRNLTRFMPFEPISGCISGDDVPMPWHDRISRTRVVVATPKSTI